MKTFRYKKGHEAGKTLTVAELREVLSHYPDDMPVMAEWECVWAYVCLEAFSIQRVSKGMEEDACDCLVLGVDEY